MSAYVHQMEREFTAQSLSSGGGGSGTELGSNYVVESGFYITSFAATIFIAAIVSVGVLLMTLLIALTVMLQTCQSQSAGVLELQRSSDGHNYCNTFTLHAELNGLKSEDFPSECRVIAYQYLENGHYAKDLKNSVRIAEKYFNNVKPSESGLDVVMLDIDDLLPPDPENITRSTQRFHHIKCLKEAINLKKMLLLKLFTQLRERGWAVILLSRDSEKVLNSTKDGLNSAGLEGWSSVIMRMDEEMHISSHDYFSRRRMAMQNEGQHISAIISSHMDALSGPYLGRRVFKLPNLMYHQFVNPVGDTDKAGNL